MPCSRSIRCNVRFGAVLAVVLLLATGCGLSVEKRSIPAAPAERASNAPNLGPGVRPLSFGPGDKSSPSWSPSGEKLAFVVDGYAIEKTLYAQESTRRTPKDFEATRVEWNASGESLAMLAPPQPTSQEPPEAPEPAADREALAVYGTTPGDAPEVQKILDRTRAISPTPGHESVVAATEVAPYQTELGLVSGEALYQPYGTRIEGRVTGLSVSPDGRRSVVATQEATALGRFGIQTYDLLRDEVRPVIRLGEMFEVLGEPQSTSRGIYYVAGERREPGSEEDTGLYTLYRIPDGSGTPESVTGVGEDFVASSLRVSPEGDRLAIVGRRNQSSSTNLYVLDLRTGELSAVTVNESMEIKTGPENLAWSPDGESVAVIARGILSGPEVYDAPVESLLEEFYNLYEVPATPAGG